MPTDEKIITTLDAQDVRALRNADSLVFQQNDGQGSIRAIKDGRHTPDGFDAEHRVYTDCTINDYGTGWDWDEHAERDERLTPETATCFHMEYNYDPTTASLLRRLGTGDTIRLVWTRDNNNEIIRKAGLHADCLRLEVSKKGDRNRRETYLVDYSICYDNSARMIRRAR